MRGLNFVLGMMGSHWRVLKGREVGSDGDGRDVWYSLALSSEQNKALCDGRLELFGLRLLKEMRGSVDMSKSPLGIIIERAQDLLSERTLSPPLTCPVPSVSPVFSSVKWVESP